MDPAKTYFVCPACGGDEIVIPKGHDNEMQSLNGAVCVPCRRPLSNAEIISQMQGNPPPIKRSLKKQI